MLAFAFVRLTTSHFSVAFKLHKIFHAKHRLAVFHPTVTTIRVRGHTVRVVDLLLRLRMCHEEQLDEVEHDDDYMDVDYDPSADFDEEEHEDDRIDESDDE